MDANDVDFARDVFADLVVAWTRGHSQPPNSGEARRLAERAIDLARSFNAATNGSEAVPREAKPEALPEGQPKDGTTLAQLARDWGTRIVERSTGHNGRDIVTRLDRYLLPHLGSRLAGDLQPAEILSVLRGVGKLGFNNLAYQIYRDLRAMYRYAAVAGISTRDPTATIGTYIKRPKPVRSSALFHPDALGELLVAIRSYRGKVRSTARYMLRLAPMLFLRSVELRELEWREVDLDAATLVISAERMKSRRPHIVPLPRQAVSLLRDVQNVTGGSRFVFNGGHGGVDRPPNISAFVKMIRSIGYSRTLTTQGFRSMASTWLNEQGWRPDAIERQLSHVAGGGHMTRFIYNRAEYIAERRKMLQAWADYLDLVESRARRSHRAPKKRAA